MDVTFETRLPMPSLVREAREFFSSRHGLTLRDDGNGELSFIGSAGTVGLLVSSGDGGTVRVRAATTTLEELVIAFRERVAPRIWRARRGRIAANEDLERFRRLSERQPAPPRSSEAKTVSFGGGRYPG
jgi:hypothetical protein